MLLCTRPFWLADLVQGCIPYGQWGVFVELKEYLQLFSWNFLAIQLLVAGWMFSFFSFPFFPCYFYLYALSMFLHVYKSTHVL